MVGAWGPGWWEVQCADTKSLDRGWQARSQGGNGGNCPPIPKVARKFSSY